MKKPLKHRGASAPMLIGCIVALLAIGFSPYFYSLAKSYVQHKRIPYGIIVGSIDAKGMNEDQLWNSLEDLQQRMRNYGVEAISNGSSIMLRNPQPLYADLPVLNSGIISIDIHSTARDAFAYGSPQSLLKAIVVRMQLYLSPKHIPLSITVNRDELAQSLATAYPNKQRTAKAADIAYNAKTKTLDIVPEEPGLAFDINSAATDIIASANGGGMPSFTVRTTAEDPPITQADVIPLKEEVVKFFRPFELFAGEKHSWKRDIPSVAEWITVEKNTSGSVTLAARKSSIRAFLEKTVAPAVFIETKDPRFEIKNGKILITTQAQNGRKLDIDKSIERIANALLNPSAVSAVLVLNENASAPLSIPAHDSIKEVVGRAQTDFKGSPKNRRANIANGVARINGVLIQPGEEFSLLRHLAPIDDTNGFLPELVIKGNATKPEYGGGLCQVSTTLFRAVAYAGLPVIQRRNHSYRVSYYEPPVGFDATIYSPGPDFRFKNDMATPLLLQAAVQGTKLTVTFWGIKDGRISEVDTPTVYNIKKPPATKIIETTELKPGVKKCTEKAHSGADAHFERRVMYLSGEIKKDFFKSHYVVWPAVCYVGVEPSELPSDDSEQAAPVVPAVN